MIHESVRFGPMIPTTEAKAALETLLAEHGFSMQAPSVGPLWAAFRQFTTILVECADDSILCQWGTYSWAPDVFEFDLTRQFEFDEDGEYAGMKQLHCTLTFPLAVAAGVTPGNCWASEYPSMDAFWEHIESLPAFQAVRAADLALSVVVLLEDV
mgnify:CR=1 FL=1